METDQWHAPFGQFLKQDQTSPGGLLRVLIGGHGPFRAREGQMRVADGVADNKRLATADLEGHVSGCMSEAGLRYDAGQNLVFILECLKHAL